jgi:CopG family nickel-responsive transcriptional regulator
MKNLVRFGVSLEKKLLDKFDKHIKHCDYTNRSQAIADLIRKELIQEDWSKTDSEVAGTITLVFDHHVQELGQKITHIQHHYYQLIISSQHVHLDHDNCLEIIVTKGNPGKIKELCNKLQSVKGVKYASVNLATTGKGI